MKKIFIIGYFFLIVLIIINILLCIHITKSNSMYKPVYEDEIEKDKNIIPDKETAARVAQIVVETLDEYVKGIDEGIEYEITVTFDEEKYEWVVHYMPEQEGDVIFGGEIIIRIRRDNGKMYFYYTK